jgi:signal peptide peptidase SppA
MQNILLFTIKLCLVFTICLGALFIVFKFYEDYEYKKNIKPAFYEDGICNLATIAISGPIAINTLSTYGGEGESDVTQNQIAETGNVDYIMGKLDYAKNNSNMKGVILQVDSYGGYGASAEILSNYISKYPKPIVAYVRDAAASAAYWSISPSKYIVANRTSDIGSIGATLSYIDTSEKNKKDGLVYREINTGKYKDSGNPEKSLSKEEQEYLQGNINYLASIFKADVSKYRNIASSTLATFADGRVFQGQKAIDLGLIDEVGDESTVLSWFDRNIFLQQGSAIQCYPVY